MRSIPVLVQAYRLKPNTRYYAFFDDVDVTAWVSIDNTTMTGSMVQVVTPVFLTRTPKVSVIL